MKTVIQPFTRLAVFAAVVFIAWGAFINPALAQTPTVSLEVCVDGNCGPTAQVIDGQQVELRWFIDGDVNNCVITDGATTTIQVIDTSPLPGTPVTGNIFYTPPPGSQTNFTLNCDGVVDVSAAMLKPNVNIWIDQGYTFSFDPVIGRVSGRIDVKWNSTNATMCERFEYTPVSSVSPIPATGGDYWDYGRPYGSVRFDGNPRSITEDTVFGITCENEATGARTTATTSLSVVFPAGPSPVSVNMWADSYLLTPDPVLGYAYTDVHTRGYNRTWCTYSAEYENGTPMSNPPGYGNWGGHANSNMTVRFATTTRLNFECSRPAVTYGTTTYPAESASTSILVQLSSSGLSVDRTAIPPVTVTLTPVPSTATSTQLNPYTNRGSVTMAVHAYNTEYCYTKAYDNPQNIGSDYNLNDWTKKWSWRRLNANGSNEVHATITTPHQGIDTSYFVECLRTFDQNEYASNTPEFQNGYASSSRWITVVPAPTTLPAPEVYIYANPLRYEAEDMWNDSTFRSAGFNLGSHNTRFFNSQNYLNTTGTTTTQSLTFPFPYEDGVYDIHFWHCDEADGDSNVQVLVNGAPVGSYTMNNPNGGWSGCGTEEFFAGFINGAVNIDFGDDITLECTPDNGESCRIESMVFAQPGDIVAQRSAGQASVDVDVFYDSQYATHCRNQFATVGTNPPYRWTYSGWRDLAATLTLSTSTQFEVECYRNSDAAFSQEAITILIPATTTVTDVVIASAGECIDDGTFGNLGQTIDAPDGYIADTTPGPTYGFCIPAVDLAAVSPSVNTSGPGVVTDNVAGTYDGIDVLVAIENLGPGGLPANSNVSYSAQLGFPQFALPTSTSPIGFYNGSIAAPSPSPNQSSALTRTMDSVPFGTHLACARVNLDNSPDNYPEASTDFDNNISCTSVTLPVPPPPMSITADRNIIRPEQSVTLDWSINVSYQMACTVRGPGGLDQSFDTLVVGHPFSGSYTTSPLTSTSEFVFQCTEPITNTTFTETITVEVTPDYEEI